jgi:hypothetical protein
MGKKGRYTMSSSYYNSRNNSRQNTVQTITEDAGPKMAKTSGELAIERAEGKAQYGNVDRTGVLLYKRADDGTFRCHYVSTSGEYSVEVLKKAGKLIRHSCTCTAFCKAALGLRLFITVKIEKKEISAADEMRMKKWGIAVPSNLSEIGLVQFGVDEIGQPKFFELVDGKIDAKPTCKHCELAGDINDEQLAAVEAANKMVEDAGDLHD